MKYQVSWKNHQTDEYNIFETFDTFDEAMQSINIWWDKHNFTPRYVRYWKDGDVWTIDYGLHHSFYYIKEKEEYKFSVGFSTEELKNYSQEKLYNLAEEMAEEVRSGCYVEHGKSIRRIF